MVIWTENVLCCLLWFQAKIGRRSPANVYIFLKSHLLQTHSQATMDKMATAKKKRQKQNKIQTNAREFSQSQPKAR